MPLFRFVQVEVPWPLGPDDGRYVVRRHAGEEPEHVVVIATLGTVERRRLGGKKAKPVGPEPDATPVATGRATVIPTAQLGDEDAAGRWLRDADGEAEVAAALRILNRALHAYRISVADPSEREVVRDDALVARIGFGAGEQVADGRWTEALELPPPKPRRERRAAALRPQERVAALLSGRDATLACELLVLRSRSDLDAGRLREAALQLSTALETALAELPAWAERGDLATRIDELAGLEEEADAVAATALDRGLDDAEAATVERVLGRLEAALRARTAAGIA